MFEKLLAGLAASLKRYGIPYMIIGGQAVLLYGEPRLLSSLLHPMKGRPSKGL